MKRIGIDLFNINAHVHKVLRCFHSPSVLPKHIRRLVFVLFVFKKPCSLKTFCAINEITPSNGSIIAEKLVKDGIIIRETDPTDRRKVVLSLTPKYHDILNREYEEDVKNVSERLSFLSEEELAEFADAASKVDKYLNKIIKEYDLV